MQEQVDSRARRRFSLPLIRSEFRVLIQTAYKQGFPICYRSSPNALRSEVWLITTSGLD